MLNHVCRGNSHHATLIRNMDFQAGDIVKLHERYGDSYGSVGLIIYVERAECLGNGGWITFDYAVLVSSGQIVHMSSSCFEPVDKP